MISQIVIIFEKSSAVALLGKICKYYKKFSFELRPQTLLCLSDMKLKLKG